MQTYPLGGARIRVRKLRPVTLFRCSTPLLYTTVLHPLCSQVTVHSLSGISFALFCCCSNFSISLLGFCGVCEGVSFLFWIFFLFC